MVINVTDNEIIKAHIGELSKIFDSTEKESQATNITSLAAYQTLLDIEKEANEKLRAEVERLQLKVEVIQEAKEQLEKDVFNAEMNLDGKDVEVMNLKHEIERLKAEANCADGYADALVERTKTKAIKEFAERLKEIGTKVEGRKGFEGVFVMANNLQIDNLVKEMVGDDK
jgi:DNA repair exonuclease SbcCD ATPase subunit